MSFGEGGESGKCLLEKVKVPVGGVGRVGGWTLK